MGLKDRLVPALEAGDVTAGWEVLHDLHGDERREAKAAFEPAKPGRTSWTTPPSGTTGRRRANRTTDRRTRLHRSCPSSLHPGAPDPRARRSRTVWTGYGSAPRASRGGGIWSTTTASSSTPCGGLRLGSGLRRRSVEKRRVRWVGDPFRRGASRSACPSGEAFLEVWTVGAPITFHGYGPNVEPDADEWLHADPLLPDLAYHLLNSDHCGSDLGVATRGVGCGVELDVLDRSRLLEVVLHRADDPAPSVRSDRDGRDAPGVGPAGRGGAGRVRLHAGRRQRRPVSRAEVRVPAGARADVRSGRSDLTILVAGREKVHKRTLLRRSTTRRWRHGSAVSAWWRRWSCSLPTRTSASPRPSRDRSSDAVQPRPHSPSSPNPSGCGTCGRRRSRPTRTGRTGSTSTSPGARHSRRGPTSTPKSCSGPRSTC